MRSIDRLYFAGLLTGPIGWAATLQTAYSLVSAECASASIHVVQVTLVGAAIALAGATISWTARSHFKAAGTRHFVAGLSAGAALLFALAILFQMAAAFVFKGCEI
jgi:hypothetical protein